MTDRIFPSWDKINVFKNPLTAGELQLSQFLDKNLRPEWEIYIQPFVNGDRPDIIVLNPSVGRVGQNIRLVSFNDTHCSGWPPPRRPNDT